MDRYYWIVDLDRCIGCESCVLACKQEQKPARGVQYRRVYTVNPEQYPAHPTYRISLACNHCQKPACLQGCPVQAYQMREGVVFHDPNQCVGCKYCTWVCPYDAPRYSEEQKRVQKCNLCWERLQNDLQPACVEACPTGALQLVEHLETATEQELRSTVPGFPEDSTGCKIRIKSSRRISPNKRS